MEAHSQTDDTPKSRDILEGQLRESYGRVVYSHKTHEKCADILLTRQQWIRITTYFHGRGNSGFHAFRHAGSSIINELTGDLKLSQVQMGHKRLSTTANIYTHTNGARLSEPARCWRKRSCPPNDHQKAWWLTTRGKGIRGCSVTQ